MLRSGLFEKMKELAGVHIRLQGKHIFFKSVNAFGRDAAERLGIIILELLGNLDIFCFLQLIYLYAQVSRSGICFLLYKSEFGLLQPDKQADDGQA